MALRAIMLRREIERKRADLAQLLEQEKVLEAKEAEIEAAIDEAESDDQREAVAAEVDAFEADQTKHKEEKAGLVKAIEALEEQLSALEAQVPDLSTPAKAEEKSERSRIEMNSINIRSLPMNQRAFESLPAEQRRSILAQEDVKSFLTQLRSFKGQTRAITGGELTIPVVFLDLIAENMYRYSKLMNRVRVRVVNGEARQTIAGVVPEAVWTECCGAINELTFAFNQVTLDCYKVAGYVPVCNSLLEDNDVNLASWIVEMISEAIGLAKDKAILYGTGNKMPQGIVTRLAQTAQPAGYPATAPAWVDLHSTNIQTIAANLTGAEFWSALMLATGNTFTRYSRGRQFWAMNSRTYALLKSKAITFTAAGDVVANVYGVLPIVTGDIDILEFMPDGDIVGGYGDLYLWAQRAGMTIEASTEAQFIQDNTVFRGKERADGMPVIPGAFVAININGAAVTTVMDFAADAANDADLESLTIGNLSLTPAFSADVTTYAVTATAASNAVTAAAESAGATVSIAYNGKAVTNGATVTWATGTNPLTVTVASGNARKVYTVNITKNA